MNPQYMQQRPSYGPPATNTSYGELNANLPAKGSNDSQSFPPQKPPTGPQPVGNGPPTARSPYYVNDVQADPRHGPPFQQSNQNNLVDQMSNIALSGPPRPPQNYAPQSDKTTPPMPFQPPINGHKNQNHFPPQGETSSNNLPEKSGPPQKPSIQQQAPLATQTSSLPSSYGPPLESQFPGHQYPGQSQPPPPASLSGPNVPRSTPQSNSPINHNQMLNQTRTDISSANQADLLGKPPGPTLNPQQSYRGPPSSQLQGPPMNQPPAGGPPPSQLQGPPMNQPPVGGPPQSIPGSFPPTRQNLPGPPLPGQIIQNPPMGGPQGLSRPPLVNQAANLSGPPPLGQAQYPAGPYGQPNMSGPPPPLPGQQNYHLQYPYNNQPPEQRRISPSPTVSGQHNINPYLNHQPSDPIYNQGYVQNCGPPGQSNMYVNQNPPYQGGYQPNNPSAQARKLDPDQMPSPIQVIQEDQRLKGGVFITNQKGLVPPLVTTKFTVEDQGNASPRFIRSSMYTVPTTTDIIKQTQVPFSLILSPMANIEENEFEPPIVDMGEIGPVRCVRCKAYMSPFMQFIDAGRRFQCMFCKAVSEVPAEYFQHLDHAGQRLDRLERPELMLGTYEFIATKDYCRNNTFPKPPAIIFIIDVSYNNIKSGLVNLLCARMKQIIRNLPVDIGQTKSNMKVGFITYNSTVHFYNLKANLAQPQMMVVGDIQDVFMPLLDGFLCDPEESEALIDNLMSQIPTMFGDTRETETILAPAIQAGLEALKASECTGKLMVFHSSLPIAEAPGKLKNRDDRKLLGTDKEKSVIAPQTNFYNNLGQDCVGFGCSVDLFIFNNSYVDIATIGQVCRLTGGELYKYTYFQADIDGERLIVDIMNNLNRPVAFDAVMRVRTSTGVRPVDFYGHFFMSNTTDIELASIDSDKAIAVEIKHDDKLTEEEGVYIQAALLYTSCSGIRRLRIINLSLKTSSQMSELYRACDLDAIINYLSKQCVFKLVDQPSKVIKDNLNSRCAAILASYRKHCASPTSAGQLILPECMKLLPLYINGLLKSDAITGGAGTTVDQKSYVMMMVATMPISESIVHVYPRLLQLHDCDPSDTELPPMLRCSIDKFTDDGAYLLENGIYMFLWLGSNLSSQWVQSVFGMSSVAQVDTDRTTIPPLDNPLNKRIRQIITYVQTERRYCMRLTLTKQRDKMEMVMRQFLVEDRDADGSPSYVDYLCHMHREIRTLLS